jgi:hypothetical protein
VTLSEIQADLYRRLGLATSPASSETTRLTALINETQQEILARPGMGALLNGSFTFDSVASTPQYSLPPAVARVKTLYETTNDRRLVPQSLDWYRGHYPDVAAITGTPESFIDLGFTSLSAQPAAATELFADSSSASDINTAYLEGYRTGGYYMAKSVVMTGTTGVTFSSAITDWIFLTKFYLSAAAVGTVVLQTTLAGGTTLATIPIGQTMARYRRLALAPTPSAIITYTMDVEYDVPVMAIATDEPVLPPRFHRLLAMGARAKEWEGRDDDRANAARRDFDRGVSQLEFFMFSQAAGSPNLRGTGRAGLSTLGSWYPSGS